MLVAMAYFIFSLVWAKMESSTNILYSVALTLIRPELNLQGVALVNFLSFEGGSEKFYLTDSVVIFR